jgi:tripartite-type tricarboxylate transporter receptor subunit TctC
VRCLGVTATQRSPLLPDTPTIAEQGLKGFQSYNWNGLLAPAAMPKPIVARIHEVISNALKTPEAQKLYTSQGHEVSGIGPDEYAAFIKAETQKWAQVAKRAGISKQ